MKRLTIPKKELEKMKSKGPNTPISVRPTDDDERAVMRKYAEILGGISDGQLILRAFRAMREMVEAGVTATLPRDIFILQQALAYSPIPIENRLAVAYAVGEISREESEPKDEEDLDPVELLESLINDLTPEDRKKVLASLRDS